MFPVPTTAPSIERSTPKEEEKVPWMHAYNYNIGCTITGAFHADMVIIMQLN